MPDAYELQDAARLASLSMLARMDMTRRGQPFFRIYPFAKPPYAEHQKWDDGDMTGRYVEALILARRMTGVPMDLREALMRQYLASLYDSSDGLCYTQGTAWTPRRACLFSQSCAMMGLLAWLHETGSPQARQLLDRHVDGLLRIAVDRDEYCLFPKYEFDGSQYVDDPQGKDAPTWYGGRLILPLVDYWQLTGRDDVKVFLEKLIHYSTAVSQGIKPDGEVRGNGWWGHLHSTMDMATGITRFGRLTGRPELVEWAKRVYDWIGRTHTTRYGWVSDAAGSSICESCAIASRIRLGCELYRAGVVDPFDEIDRHVRNQLLENQFVDLSFLGPLGPEKPRTEQFAYAHLDRMIRGTFQCWGAANDLIGHDEIEGCGAGGGVQALALAWEAQTEWRELTAGQELRIHLLFNRRVRGAAEPPLSVGTPVAAEVWSWLPREGRAAVVAHRPLVRLAVRVPDGAMISETRVRRLSGDSPATNQTSHVSPIAHASPAHIEDGYVLVENLAASDRVELDFSLREYETVEMVHDASYKVHWKGNAVVSLEPSGTKVPLYAGRDTSLARPRAMSAPRYP